MSWGPYPWRTLPGALSVARLRGGVWEVVRGRKSHCDFVIITATPLAFVRARFAPRILATPAEIGRDSAPDLLRLRSIGAGSGISRELWLRSKHDTWRFFRVGDIGLVELSREGRPIKPMAGSLKERNAIR